MPELADPDDGVPTEDWPELIRARVACGLKPFPNRSDDDYFNTIIDICSVCGASIYGGQAISMGYGGTRCEECFDTES
jgi:hypothetical protein